MIPRLWSEQGHLPTNEMWIDTSGDFIKANLGTVAVDHLDEMS